MLDGLSYTFRFSESNGRTDANCPLAYSERSTAGLADSTRQCPNLINQGRDWIWPWGMSATILKQHITLYQYRSWNMFTTITLLSVCQALWSLRLRRRSNKVTTQEHNRLRRRSVIRDWIVLVVMQGLRLGWQGTVYSSDTVVMIMILQQCNYVSVNTGRPSIQLLLLSWNTSSPTWSVGFVVNIFRISSL